MSDLKGLVGKRIRATVFEGRKLRRVIYEGVVDREVKDGTMVAWVGIRRNARTSSDRYIGSWTDIEVLEPDR